MTTKRNAVLNARARAAREFAALKGEATPEAVKEAARLLQRCVRFALAYQRHCENETEYNHNKTWYVHEGELLDARWCKLDKELEAYGAILHCGGYFCVNVYTYDAERHGITSNGFLHFFD